MSPSLVVRQAAEVAAIPDNNTTTQPGGDADDEDMPELLSRGEPADPESDNEDSDNNDSPDEEAASEDPIAAGATEGSEAGTTEASAGPTPVQANGVIDLTAQKKRIQTLLPGTKAVGDGPDSKECKKASPKKYQVFLNQDKLNILDEIDRKESTQIAICARHGVSRVSIGTWQKNRDEFKRVVVEEGRANLKRLHCNDPLKQVKDKVRTFYELNESMPKDLKIPITCE